MRVAYVGTHQPMTERGTPWTTETAWASSLELLGHEVVRVEESEASWPERLAVALGCDLFLWTSTWGHNEKWPIAAGFQVIRILRERGIPTASLHLDRWWGLSNREWQVTDRRAGSAMFTCDFVFTPDGDHDDDWQRADVAHFWLPPGVYGPECVPGTPRDEWRADVGFVGNRNYGHAEHAPTRKAMLDALDSAFGDRVAYWPRPGEPLWGLDYNDMLASTKVVVADAWDGAERYWSNRAYETIGRGGFIAHPAIPGLVEAFPEGMGVAYFPPDDLDAMCATVDRWVSDDAGRAEAVAKGQAFVRAHHTYTRRLAVALAIMQTEGAWR